MWRLVGDCCSWPWTASYHARRGGYVQRSRDALRTVFDGLDHGVMLLDRSGRVLALNQVMAAWLGAPIPDVVGQPWQRVQQAAPAFPGQLVLRTLHDSRPRRRRERMIGGSGRPRVLNLQTLPLLHTDQSLDQVIVTVTDMTEQLQLEAMAARYEADEVMVLTITGAYETRRRSYELLMEEMGPAS